MAVVAMVTCCALPVLISSGVLATIGGVLRNPLIVAAEALVLGGAVAYARRRLQRGQTCAVSDAAGCAHGDTARPAMTARPSATAVELVASLPPTAQPVRAAVFAILAAFAA